MAKDPLIDYAQEYFGNDEGLPEGSLENSPVPPWVTTATPENTVRLNDGDSVRAEDQHSNSAPNPVEDTTIPETLAYYLPYHFYRESWGIYIRAAGVCALADRLQPKDGSNDVKVMDFSQRLLLEHERFHFFAEYAASRLEVAHGEPCYEAYFKNAEAALHEEGVANAHSIRTVRRLGEQNLTNAAKAWMDKQPEGYREFRMWLAPNFEKGRRLAAKRMFPKKAALIRTMLESKIPYPGPAEFLFFHINPRRSPVYVVLDTGVPWLTVAKPFPKDYGLQVHVRTHDHKPEHIHIDYPPGKPYTRYLFPELVPYPNDPGLRSSGEKNLRKYVAKHGSDIDRKVKTVVWQ